MADVPVSKLAEEWGITTSNARKYVRKKGVPTRKVIDPTKRGQRVLVLAPADADRIRILRMEETIS